MRPLQVLVLPPLPRARPPPDCHAWLLTNAELVTTRRPPGPKYMPAPKAGTLAFEATLDVKLELATVTTVPYWYGQ
jgi:hypothetical protein